MNNSPTSLFDSYEQDFQQFIDTIRQKLDADGNADDAEARKTSLRRVEMELDEADEMVSQMEIEIQGIPTSLRSQYQTRLRSAKADLARYKKAYRDSHARADLLARAASPAGFASSDNPYGGREADRARALAGVSLLEDGAKRLQDSQRIALETEEQGAEILTNLRQQREQIENSRSTLQMADNSIDRASGTLKKMIRRMYQQRVLTGAIIFILVLLIGIIVWEKFI